MFKQNQLINLIKKSIRIMKKLLALSFVFLFCVNCSDDDDTEVYRLNTFEKTVIPFDNNTQVQYVNQDMEIFMANYTPKESGMLEMTGGEYSASGEFVSNEINFTDLELNLFNRVYKQGDLTNFFITNLEQVGSSFPNACFLSVSENLEVALTDITIQGFEYNSVFSFEICDYIEANDNPVKSIIYSAERGIEFIEFLDGTYLRQISA
jgi:hypothetical protein